MMKLFVSMLKVAALSKSITHLVKPNAPEDTVSRAVIFISSCHILNFHDLRSHTHVMMVMSLQLALSQRSYTC